MLYYAFKKNNFQHPCFRSSGESIGVCVWGLSRRDLSIVTPAGSWETFFYNIWEVSVWQSKSSNTSVCSYHSFDSTVCCCLVVVLWGVLSFAPSWFTAAVHLCVCWVFTYSCFYMFILGGGGNKLFDWTHSGCNPLNDQQMETWLHLQARGFDHVITALGDRMSKSGWIPSLLVIQSWHYFCASHMFLWGCPAQKHFNRTSSIFILKVTAAKYHLSRWKRCKPPQPIVSDPGRIW